MLKTSKLKNNQQNNDVIQVCFILEGYHQRGPTHPTEEDTDRPYSEGFHQRGPKHPTEEDTDRPYPEGFHQRGPTHPTEDTDRPYQRSSIREDQHIQLRKIDRPYSEGFHQRGPKHRTEEDTDRPYSEGFHQIRRPPNHRKSKPTDTTSKRNQQWQTREYQTAEQNTSIKVKYCKTVYLIR